MLEISSIDVYHGDLQALWDVSLSVQEREIVALIGPNGAGKSTLLNTVCGLLRPRRGSMTFNGVRLDQEPTHRMVHLGISLAPEGKRLFPSMSVLENLELGAFIPENRKAKEQSLKQVYELFPILEERKGQAAGTLSGGEQQMLAIGRSLMSRPKLLLLDEPSLGLSPLLSANIFAAVAEINKSGVAILLVEQNVLIALELAHRAYILESGHIVGQGEAKSLLDDRHVKDAYLGTVSA